MNKTEKNLNIDCRNPKKGTVICRISGCRETSPQWGYFEDPVKIIETTDVEHVNKSLFDIEKETSRGRFAAGFISYEASPAFDSAHTAKQISDFPLVWFGIYDKPPQVFNNDFIPEINLAGFEIQPELSEGDYLSAIRKIKKYIYDGDIYQANFTFRSILSIPEIAPYKLFSFLFANHFVPFAAYVNTGRHELVSLSPELFLEKQGRGICSKPMKGTAKRQLSYEDDIKAAEALSLDPKNRAENIMIVDMVRNDFGRICEIGSIQTGPVYKVDTYDTVHQMISQVKGKLPPGVSFVEIMMANFPAASITGAPKIRSMQIIDELEKSPRKVYTGSIGCLEPNGDFCFNVAIRTLIFLDGKAELGIGSGVVADSDPFDEWNESLLKSTFVSRQLPKFELLETILWTNESGFVYLKEHLQRLRNSHNYFRWHWNQDKIIEELNENLSSFDGEMAKIRLLISKEGNVKVEVAPYKARNPNKKILKLKISGEKTRSTDLFLYHKTTNRKFYNDQYRKALNDGYDEVLFLNENEELTEGAISNVFIFKNNHWLTPPVSCGLLPGVWRGKKLAELNASEQKLKIIDLKEADKILIGNSVRGQAEGEICW